ncbi:MAG TPA: hypothetical protein VG245_10525, partial [Candidatus Dormibacteraeota bacterium]|nr:hypothetical protein [Candidatus Dormibacteraeota bacterium]
MECLLAGLFGLAPSKRGGGHQGALRDASPWNGEPCGLSLAYRLDGGRIVEVDWDFSGERTQVIDHTGGDDISAEFTGGTHGWLDVGQAMLGVSSTVFRQFTCVGEGELAVISDDAEIRESLLRLSDSGVDVLVEQAITRLEDAARQSTIPKANSATRRNALERDLVAAQRELDRVTAARTELDAEVHAIAQTESAIGRARDEVAGMMAEDERRQEEQRRLSAEIERAYGRLAEAELRRASLSADADVPKEGPPWSDADIETARQLLVSPEEAGKRRGRLPLIVGLLLILAGIGGLAGGLVAQLVPMLAAGAAVAAIGVLLVTRGGMGAARARLRVGAMTFPDRAALMIALDHQRARRELAQQQNAVDDIQARLDQLLQPAADIDGGAPREVQARLSAAKVRQTELRLQLERQRTSLSVRSSQVGDVAALEEQVAGLGSQIAELEAFGESASLAAQHLKQASEEIRRAYAPKLQAYLSRDLPRITSGRYSEAVVNDKFEVMVRAPETNQMVDLGRL